MSNRIELITGHGESNHISSFDMRAFNRAVFGKDKYIFTDAENMGLEVDVSGKTFLVKSGSCMWSGMHIRVEEYETVSFVSPATSDNVYLWLHYTRNNSTLVEDIEFVTTTSSMVDSSFVYDKLPDDITEAYTLFATIEFDAVNNIVKNTEVHFEAVKGMSDFYTETAQRLTSQAAENTATIKSLEKDINDTINNFRNEIVTTAHSMELLFDGKINATGKRDYVLTDSLYKYRHIIVHIGDYQYIWTRPYQHYINGKFYVPLEPELEADSITIAKLKVDYYDKNIGFSYQSTKVYRESLGTYFESTTEYSKTVKIYGIGKGV